MQSMSARDAKNSFGKLIDIARAEPVAIEKHGRAVVVVLSIEAYERLQFARDTPAEAMSVDSQSGDLRTRQAAMSTITKLVGKS
jgi:prevent-host-death family protein